MALTYIIAGGDPSSVASGRPFIEMDATISLSPTMSGKVTKHPVEDGSKIADHVVIENKRFSVDGYVSNAPVFLTRGNVLGVPSQRRTQIAYDTFETMFDNKVVFTLVTEFKSYPNCIITSLNMPKTGSVDSLHVQMEVEQIRVVSSKFVLFVAPEAKDDSTDTQHGGKGQTNEINFLSRVIELIGDTRD